MRLRPHFEFQSLNPFRHPAWRWQRAHQLISTGQYMSGKRDDRATGIAVRFLREFDKCLTERRQRNVRNRFQHVVGAHDIWHGGGFRRLELETRILGRQNETEIALEMDLPPSTVQAYADLFFHVRERINATSYITFQIIGFDPKHPPTPMQLMQLCVYHHGPCLIEPWFAYLRSDRKHLSLESPEGRLMASLDLLVAAHSLCDDHQTHRSLLKRIPFLVQKQKDFAKSVPAATAYRKTTAAIMGELGLPTAEMEPCSYAPASNPTPSPVRRQHSRQAA